MDVVHEAPNEKNPAAARLENVFWGKRVRDFGGVEAFALIAHRNLQPGRAFVENLLELNENALGSIVVISVLDRVDHRFADRDAHPMHRLVVEADLPRDMIADNLHEVEHVEGARELETNSRERHAERYHPI